MRMMTETMERPRFFPGLPIDYRDFNRLAEQPDRLLSVLCRSLYPEGGLFLGSSEDFRIEVTSESKMEVQVCPGTGLLPDGSLIRLSRPLLIRCQDYPSRGETLVFALGHNLKGQEHYVDEEDSAISGFKAEAFETEVRVGRGVVPENALELFRIQISEEVTQIRLASEPESKRSDPLPDGVVDQRFRSAILSPTRRPIEPIPLLRLREKLFRAVGGLSSLKGLFSLRGEFFFQSMGVQLQGALLEVPLQGQKVGFLVSEIARSFAQVFSALLEQVPRSRKDFSGTRVEELLERAQEFFLRKDQRIDFQPAEFEKFLDQLNDFANSTDDQYDQFYLLQSAVNDLRHKVFSYQSDVLLAGRPYSRVALVESGSEGVQVEAQDQLRRRVASVYSDGEKIIKEGLFLAKGRFQIRFSVQDGSQAAVLMFRHFSRRNSGKIQFLLNGKLLSTLPGSREAALNQWQNLGWVLPAESLVLENNCLSILVSDHSLDFGFFQLAAYQKGGR